MKPSFGGTSKSSKSSNSRKADDFDGFLLAAHRTKPLIHVPPWRRPPEPHGVGNEGRCLGERTKWSRFRRVLDHEWRIDTKVEHAISKLEAMGVKTRIEACRAERILKWPVTRHFERLGGLASVFGLFRLCPMIGPRLRSGLGRDGGSGITHGAAAAMPLARGMAASGRATRWHASAIPATCLPWYCAASISSADGMRAPSAPTTVVAP